jgi:hypothetical protein
MDNVTTLTAPAGDLFNGLIKTVNELTPVRTAASYSLIVK